MKLRFVQVPRRPDWPAWAVGIVAGWLVLVGVATWLSAREGREVTLCLFKLTTGKPCATCGSTRGVLAVLHGHFLEAWLYNPMVMTIFVVAGAMLAVRLIFARTVRLELTRWERRLVWVLALSAFAANWAYVIRYVG